MSTTLIHHGSTAPVPSLDSVAPHRHAWSRAEIDDLAHRLSDLGPEAVLADLTDLATSARGSRVPGPVVDLLLDPHAPAVVRERAFARVVDAVR